MHFINFREWGLVFTTYFGTSQNDLFFAELAMQVQYVVRCDSKNGHHKNTCFQEIGLRTQNMLTILAQIINMNRGA